MGLPSRSTHRTWVRWCGWNCVNRFGADAYTAGLVATTTIDSRLQKAAVAALRKGLLEYDRRHGYRGPVTRIDLPSDDPDVDRLLGGLRASPSLSLGIVTSVDDSGATVSLRSGDSVNLGVEAVKWARPYKHENLRGPTPKSVDEVLAAGDVVELVRLADGSWQLGQTPDAQGAIVALDPIDGAIVALSGGFDFRASKYNRATQAQRQPGSSFKPFIYSAALENGFTTATIVNDAPVVFEDDTLEDTWRPENYSQQFYGPTRLREALVRSRNLVSIRVLRTIGVSPAIRHIERFGIPSSVMPRNLSLALGSISLTPLDIADAYATFANGGYRVDAYFIQGVRDSKGEIVEEADPLIACAVCEDEAMEEMLRERESRETEQQEPEAPFVDIEYAEPAVSRQKCVPGRRHDARRDKAGHRKTGDPPRTDGPVGQDRDYERSQGCLVQWLQRGPRRDRLGRFRSGTLAGCA